jgi:predicted MPP superfamily phosphohydrolase
MRLGLVTDIHGRAAELAIALRLFRDHDVDQVVSIGDAFDAFAYHDREAEIAALLQGCGAVGVWGNHDFGVCRDSSQRTENLFGPDGCGFVRAVQPFLELDGCFFSHKEASVDPYDVLQLWSEEEEPLELMPRAQAGLSATPHKRQFVGHYHCWWAATDTGRIDWVGSRTLVLEADKRYFVVIAPVFQGWCAILDTTSQVLSPLRCAVS